ncbi:hypothetical protein T12_2384, partial [Trichinella patagoniensis]
LDLLRVWVISGQWLVWSFATYLETSFGRLPNRLDVRGGVGEDAREWLLEVQFACACSRHLFSVRFIQLPCICHGSADDPTENATGPFSSLVFDAIKTTDAWDSNYQLTATTRRGVRKQS